VLLGVVDHAAHGQVATVRANLQVGSLQVAVQREGQVDLDLQGLVVEVLPDGAALGRARRERRVDAQLVPDLADVRNGRGDPGGERLFVFLGDLSAQGDDARARVGVEGLGFQAAPETQRGMHGGVRLGVLELLSDLGEGVRALGAELPRALCERRGPRFPIIYCDCCDHCKNYKSERTPNHATSRNGPEPKGVNVPAVG
jgi:hypothetical protein